MHRLQPARARDVQEAPRRALRAQVSYPESETGLRRVWVRLCTVMVSVEPGSVGFGFPELSLRAQVNLMEGVEPDWGGFEADDKKLGSMGPWKLSGLSTYIHW